MRTLGWLVPLLLAAATALAAVGTAQHWGAEDPDETGAVSLRQESVRRGGFFVTHGRTHFGGGLAGGK